MNQPLTQADHLQTEIAKAVDGINRLCRSDDPFKQFYMGLVMGQGNGRPADLEKVREKMDETMTVPNAISKAFRANTRAKQFKARAELLKNGAISKADLDVGTLTNFANISGGQALGYVSLDTQMARGTVRPNSFTLYQCLHKSGAYQVVDYWPYASATGGGLPGTAFQGYSNVASGTLSTNAGKYNLNFITLKLAVDGRAITTALAAQNSFVDVTAQENTNAALTVLESVNWSCYWGNPTLFPNQFQGIAQQIVAQNTFDFQAFSNTYAAAAGWSSAQTLFNLIYEASAQITSFKQYGRITHAFMSPVTAGALQGLVTTILNNIVTTITPSQERLSGIVVDGDLQGMRTRFGEIQFPIDLFITARDRPAQAILNDDGTNYATITGPTKPVSVSAVVASGTASGSAWTSAYIASSGVYSYAVASCDASMNESTLTYLASGAGAANVNAVSGVVLNGSVALTIVPPGAADAAVFRIYRSGLGYAPAGSGLANPGSYRYIGAVAANGSSNVSFTDYNTHIPGSEPIFLLDLDENDMALDFRYLLPLTKVELFAQNIFMPWAVCMIGGVRLKVPKFHGLITGYVPDNPDFNPLMPNPVAT
jgi:hypothetical protein